MSGVVRGGLNFDPTFATQTGKEQYLCESFI